MGFTIPRAWILTVLCWVLVAGAAPSPAHDVDSAPVLLASQQTTISEDMQQDAEESPNYVPPDAVAAAAAQDPEFAARRAKMIQQCEDNNGVHCKTQVDTELGAELLQQGGVQRLAPQRKRD